MHRWVSLLLSSIVCSFLFVSAVAAEDPPTREQILEERMEYFVKYSNMEFPWYYLAAVDQFERNIQLVRNDIPRKEGPIAIQFTEEFWVGALNPYKEDTSQASIGFFGGNGLDGNKDGFADPNDNDDVLYTIATILNEYGHSNEDFEKALMEYYGREKTVNQIMIIASIYKHFQTINLDKRVFPLPVRSDYSYRSTWGASRGWGGRRMHEGTDLYASYGVPVRATTYGVIEIMGWNNFGGWRVGIRDIHNTYHYFAHLSGFNKEVKEGDIVEPGTVVGYVGSSGYGKKGTSGRFPPHLHYGMYKYNGRTEWAFDPYPVLRRSEQQERKTK